MIPKQTADRLLFKIHNGIKHTISNQYLEKDWQIAKQCALIAVDEVIEATIDNESHYEYWQEVKTELQKLY